MKAPTISGNRPLPISDRKSAVKGWNEPDSQGDNYKSVFMDMRRQWNECYADYVIRERRWMITAFASIGVALVCSIGMAYMGTQNKLVPYVVAVDKLGDSVAVQRADLATRADARIIRSQLARWVENVRSIYQDAGAQRSNFTTAYSMIQKNTAAYNTLNEYFTKNDPFKRAENEGVSVEINTVLPITDNTWQVQWTENVHSTKGELVSTTPMQANITVAINPPSDEKTLLKNPMGVYITSFNWSPRL